MIIVNSPGNWQFAYGPLEHAAWHGFTPTDLVFPSFLFAVGNAMAFVMHKYESQGNAAFWRKILKRTFVIFLIGYLMYWFPFFREAQGGGVELSPLRETRILGVLQRIALCYFFASVILHFGSKKFAVWFAVIALFAYWFLAWVFGNPSDPYSLTGNADLRLDLWLFGASHLYHGEGMAFDPEGLLSTLPSIVNVLAGYFAGDFIRRKGNSYETISKMMMAGAVLILGALIWDMAFPINKKIWTSSFVIYTSGMAIVVLATLIYFIEIRKWRGTWSHFFDVFGKNPLFIFVLSGIWVRLYGLVRIADGIKEGKPVHKGLGGWMYDHVFAPLFGNMNGSLLYAVFHILIFWAIAWWLDKRKIYIKV
jgi:predicted acyltransferase